MAIVIYKDLEIADRVPTLRNILKSVNESNLSTDPRWLQIHSRVFDRSTYLLEYQVNGETQAFLCLVEVSSLLFGKCLVGMPYVNYGGVIPSGHVGASRLLDEAKNLSILLGVDYLEVREDAAQKFDSFIVKDGDKLNSRISLPETEEELWGQLRPATRNQVRKAQRGELVVAWGSSECLDEFYRVFATNMRDLGTPVFPKRLFEEIISEFGESAEICLIKLKDQAIAGALVLHGKLVSEVPSASSLRKYNHLNPNMLLYWSMLKRSVHLKNRVFDMGHCSKNSGTYRFKKNWGAVMTPASWQYFSADNRINTVKKEDGKFSLLIRLWKLLPIFISNFLGPKIVRGIP